MSEAAGLLDDAIGRLLADRVTRELLVEAETGAWPGDLWSDLEGAGFSRPHLPEASGGGGGDWGDAFVVLRAAGRHAVPLPLAETIVAGWLLARAGIAVPEGPLTLLTGHGHLDRERLTLAAGRVPWGSSAPHAVFVVGDRVGLVETSAGRVTRGESIAREPRDDLVFEAAPVVATAELELPDDTVPLLGATARAAQMAGALDALLAESVRYAGERVQFGRPIARFQVIQHDLARLAGQAASAGMAAAVACRAWERPEAMAGEGPVFEVGVAKVRAGDATRLAAGIAHQVHGAIGFTYEHGLHFWTRRLWTWRAEYGPEATWARALGRRAIRLGGSELWPWVTSRASQKRKPSVTPGEMNSIVPSPRSER